MKRAPVLIVLCVLLARTVSIAQERVLAAPEAYQAEGIAPDLEKARTSALNGLMQQIQVFISSAFENVTVERNAVLDQQTTSKIIARSIMSLRDVQEQVVKLGDGSFRVIKSVSKEVVTKMFALRKEQSLDYMKIAQDEILRRPPNIGSSLKHAFWGHLIARLSPDVFPFVFRLDSLASSERSYKSVLVGVPNIIESIVKGVVFEPLAKVDDDVIVWRYKVLWNGSPVAHLRYSYFDGMGQADGEVINGGTRMTFFFSKKEERAREVLIDVEYRYADQMDETLRLADSLRADMVIPTTFITLLPGSTGAPTPTTSMPSNDSAKVAAAGSSGIPAPVKQSAVKDTSSAPLPSLLQELLRTKGSFEQTLDKINRFVRQKKIIAGSAKSFESLEGLYGVVLGKTGIVAVLRCTNGVSCDAITGRTIDLKTFGGNRLIWMELLK